MAKLYQQLGNRRGQALCLYSLAAIAEYQGQDAQALSHAEQSASLFRGIGDKAGETELLNAAGWYHALLGDHPQARGLCRRALALNTHYGSRHPEGNIWNSLGYTEYHAGDLGEAAACYEHALSIFRTVGDRWGEAAGYARKLGQRRWRCVTGAADRRRRDRRRCPCQLRAGGLCAVRGKAPLLICSGAASRRGLPYGGSTRFYGGSTRWQGHLGRFTGLRLRCGDWRAAAGGCHCASLMRKRRAAAAAVRPCVRPDPGSPPSSFPQVTCLDRSGGPVLPPLFACEMRARPALVVLAWSGDRSPFRGCTTTTGVQVSDTLNPHERPFTGMLDRHPRSASGRGGCSLSRFSLGGPPFPGSGAGECSGPCRW